MAGVPGVKGLEDPDPITLLEKGGDQFWIHNASQLDKPLTTRVGVAGHVTGNKKPICGKSPNGPAG